MEHSTHTDLYWEFSSALKEFDGNKLLQISMDGPNISLRFLNDIAKDCVADEQHKLIFIGACGLHVTWSIQDWCRINRLENEKDLKSSLSNPP